MPLPKLPTRMGVALSVEADRESPIATEASDASEVNAAPRPSSARSTGAQSTGSRSIGSLSTGSRSAAAVSLRAPANRLVETMPRAAHRQNQEKSHGNPAAANAY